uniref:Molybdate-anion transporter n=1 Tax=Haemonchus contortus TaxID=6289 RepID=A0A7I4YPE1_HAECO
MFDVHVIAWIWCGLCAGASILVANLKRKTHPRDAAENNAEFRGLQRRFLFPYLIVLFSESLQGPYLYAFFYDLHYLPSQIAVLYVVGLISNMVFSFYCVHLSARYGRRALCLLCITAGVFGCGCKLSTSFVVLFIGRILDGLFAALVTSPFHQWYVDEHQIAFDFPPEWIQSTFLMLSLGAGFLAVTAGITSHIVVGISKVIVLPYILSIASLVIGGAFITSQWQENRSVDAPLPFKNVIGKALAVIRSNPMAFVISVTSCCAEMASQMFVFVWAPLFIRAEHSGMKSVYALGVIYASFVASYLAGLLLFSSLAKRMRNSRLLLLSMTIAFLVFVVAIRELPYAQSDWTATRFERVFLCLVVFEMAYGVYNPSMEALQAIVLPYLHQRSVLLALVRLPLTFFVSLSILAFFPTPGGEFKLMVFIVVQLFIAAMLSLLLDAVVMNRGYEQDPDRFVLPKTIPTDSKQPPDSAISHLSAVVYG